MHTVTIGGGKTVQFETEEQVVLLMACTLPYQQFRDVYLKSKGKKPPLRLYRQNTTPESKVRFLTMASETECSDGSLLIDNLPGGREKWEEIS